MQTDRGSSSSASDNATTAGNEAIGEIPQSQQAFPPRDDTPVSHIRTVLQILELAESWGRVSHHPGTPDDVSIERRRLADIRNNLAAAVTKIESENLAIAELLRDLAERSLVARNMIEGRPTASRDRAQLALVIGDFQPKPLPHQEG